MMDTILKSLLEQVADLHDIPVGAYNIRNNGQSEGRLYQKQMENLVLTLL